MQVVFVTQMMICLIFVTSVHAITTKATTKLTTSTKTTTTEPATTTSFSTTTEDPISNILMTDYNNDEMYEYLLDSLCQTSTTTTTEQTETTEEEYEEEEEETTESEQHYTTEGVKSNENENICKAPNLAELKQQEDSSTFVPDLITGYNQLYISKSYHTAEETREKLAKKELTPIGRFYLPLGKVDPERLIAPLEDFIRRNGEVDFAIVWMLNNVPYVCEYFTEVTADTPYVESAFVDNYDGTYWMQPENYFYHCAFSTGVCRGPLNRKKSVHNFLE